MGEVYQARDTRLDRDVAIKLLPPAFAEDPERLARFEREAKVPASRNHPHIAHIYGVEGRALVMELVEGESPRGSMSFDEAWRPAVPHEHLEKDVRPGVVVRAENPVESLRLHPSASLG